MRRRVQKVRQLIDKRWGAGKILSVSLITYIKDTRSELRHVNWSTRSQAINFTALVIVFSLAIAFILAALDFLFVGLLKFVI